MAYPATYLKIFRKAFCITRITRNVSMPCSINRHKYLYIKSVPGHTSTVKGLPSQFTIYIYRIIILYE
ncbi:hypothetical protein NEPAR06_0535 [Nematocida parisii]|uniref:Uncharacterized protein n=1 Tax=Nematocida parisii (strain ERTm3) TaxID=935791 RepID=I3EI86_NEMP3|nr:uncharacterized protein NEPG_01855 [Nematocida parisii ERTm1]EIJ88933.1 hypothetical protein NEQG_00752 [Nematocida parisii ERTm3]KAI5143659.1 hypothetical protein NEPAR07_0757 [Nematocida parisii]EIJ93513.1 hypothetical protein NEPG_01855 [Nematocida parisii ERTm1]KAI5153541.1 hypothetical protein NEPAR06_0535 [Nematocida parisii]KAI5156445.1 hypothetical protein NEPAR05_0575 [Nematocida parisii]|eukprot:XP_013059683.1 hypothetical protein NEPG_01855 [Nematocida parisii ERTm1]